MDWLDVGMILLGLVSLVVVAVYLFERLGSRPERCPDCGSALPRPDAPCSVCDAPYQPAEGRPEAGPPLSREDPARERAVPEPTEHGEAGVLNPGVKPWMVKWAFGLMMLGLATRLLGMLEPAGLELGIPVAVTTALTVVGGVGMFMGFVVLDVA